MAGRTTGYDRAEMETTFLDNLRELKWRLHS